MLLDIDRCPVPDILGQGKHLESEVLEEHLRIIVLLPVLGTLKQLEVGLEREASFPIALDEACCRDIPSLNPDEDVCVKDHENAPREERSSLYRQTRYPPAS